MAKTILLLGSGHVAHPILKYLLETTDYAVVCASLEAEKAREWMKGFPRGKAVFLDVSNREAVETLVKDCHLVVSLLPYTFHVAVAEVCLKHRKSLVTTSYVSEEMRALDEKAKEVGVLFLNEIGLDPGIDHMSAMRIIDLVVGKGGKVTEFKSYCGGLPAPEANDNPLGYKFSWSPRGVLMAGRNAARYLENDRILEIAGPDLFNHCWPLEIQGYQVFEAYPNRNSLPYMDLYGLKDVKTMFRGTLRNPGWCRFWFKMAQLGWLNDAPRTDLPGKTWCEALRDLVPGKGTLIGDLQNHWKVSPDAGELKTLEWLGLFGNDKIPTDAGNLLDLLCGLLIKKLAYRPGERDMVVLFHDFSAEYPDGKKERITSTLVDFGVPNGDSSMSRTVSLPAAIAAKNMLEGRFDSFKGVQIPVNREIYTPVLNELETLKIRCEEKTSPLPWEGAGFGSPICLTGG